MTASRAKSSKTRFDFETQTYPHPYDNEGLVFDGPRRRVEVSGHDRRDVVAGVVVVAPADSNVDEARLFVDALLVEAPHVHEKPRFVDVRVRGRDDDHAGDDVAPVVPGYFDAPARAVED